MWAGVVLAAAAAATSAPVPLHRVEPRTPVETGGTGLGPTVTARLHVDPLGKVVAVDVAGIVPSTRFDAAFRKETVETLRRWRFAPARRDGTPVSAEFELAIRYRPREEQSMEVRRDGARRGGWSALAFVGQPDDRAWTAHLSGPGKAQRDARLAERIARAEALLVPEARKVASTPRFEVVTDAPAEGAAPLIGQILEASFGTVHGIFGERIPPQPDDERIHVYVYRSRDAFRRLSAADGLSTDTQGFHDPVGLLAFHVEVATQESLIALALHEGTHAYVHRRLVKPGVQVPLWLSEGLAEYVENSEIRDGRVVAGALREQQVFHDAARSWSGTSGAQLELAGVRAAIRRGDAIPLADLVAARPVEFYGERARYFYAQSWLFVHFLRHGRAEWAQGAFPRFMLAVAEGFDAQTALRDAYGGEARELEAAFRAYVGRI
jgi:hypothetical protein